MAGIFSSVIFNNTIFNVGDGSVVVVPVVTKTGTGGIDKGGIYKPTGLLRLPKKKIPTQVDLRIEETEKIHHEVVKALEKQVLQEESFKPLETMTLSEIDAEIGFLLKKQRLEQLSKEDEMLIFLIAGL